MNTANLIYRIRSFCKEAFTAMDSISEIALRLSSAIVLRRNAGPNRLLFGLAPVPLAKRRRLRSYERYAFLLCTSALWLGGSALAVCIDNDGDGYGNPASPDCTHPQLDCNDNDPLINPGRPERCDGVDNNCSGVNNEGFDVGAVCEVVDPPGCTPGAPTGCCVTGGTKVCTDDGLSTRCLTGDVTLREPEGPGGDPSCFDLVDNDCDGLVDHQDPQCQTQEFCNGFDDDNDGVIDNGFPGLGTPCSVGVGACQRNGLRVCAPNGLSVVCSVTPGPPVAESGAVRCSDGIDNDCDGLTDIADPDCQGPEICDGIDNDGDGLIDETFPDLGSPCSVGQGQCQRFGVKVCSPDRLSTVCSVVPGVPSPEGPTGPTCSDGIDNDCDGLIDDADVSCNAAALQARCAMPFLLGRGKSGVSQTCTSWNRILFETEGHSAGARVTAELHIFDLDGNLILRLPVENGDIVELASLRFPRECITIRSRNNRHRIFAPLVVLRVSVEEANHRAEAFCSATPYLDVVEPSGQVISASEGDITPVLVGIPLVDPASLFVKVDGVNLLAALGLDPSSAFPGGPYNGTVMINGRMVEVSDLRVDVSADGSVLSSNTLRMTLSGLGGGGHIVVVAGDPAPGALPEHPNPTCFVDDVRDKGESSGFEVVLTSPAAGQITNVVPTPVIGQVLSGELITRTVINCASVNVAGQVFTPGDGENSANKYVLSFNELIGQTNLPLDIMTGNAPVGTFDRGSNRIVVDALNELGGRAFATRFFATGAVANEAIDLPNAFAVGLSAEALTKLFNERVQAVGQQFLDGVRAKLQEQANNPRTLHVSFSCCCDVNAKVRPVAPFASGNPNQISATLTFLNDRFRVRINLPDLTVFMAVDGKCQENGLFGECFLRSRVAVDVTTTTTGMFLEFDVTEDQIRGVAMPGEPVFNKGTTTPVSTDRGSGTSCWGCDLCEGFATVAGVILQVITLGFLDPMDNPFFDLLIPSFEVVGTQDAVQDAIGANQPDPVELGEIKIDEEQIAEFQQTLMAGLDVIDISPLGLRATLKATFQVTQSDPTVPPTPGAVLTPAVAPGFPSQIPGAGDAYVALADDTLNQFFASMTAGGLLKANCQSTGKVLGDVLNLPADCESVTGDTPRQAAAGQGRCHAFKGADCATIPTSAVIQDRIAEIATCNVVRNLNLTVSTPLLVCAQQEVPPRILIQDNAATTMAVESVLRLNDLSVAIVADRDNNGLEGDLLALRNCFAQGASSIGDCNLFAVCLDLNILNSMAFQTCADGKPGIVTTPLSIATTLRKLGVVCGAASATDDDALIDAAGGDPKVMEIVNNLEDFSPPLCANGLTLGGFVNFIMPRLIAIDVPGGDPDFQDYLAITGEIEP